jgi:toxin-antitoxin system PIN domain toxin
MQAIDTNVLIYSEIVSSQFHEPARRLVISLAEGIVPWAIPWPCIYEFLRVVTHPKVFNPPVPLALALDDLKRILESPTVILLSGGVRHAEVMDLVVRESGVAGNLLHDAHIAALCIAHGVSEILTGDGDFNRFPLTVRNPFR